MSSLLFVVSILYLANVVILRLNVRKISSVQHASFCLKTLRQFWNRYPPDNEICLRTKDGGYATRITGFDAEKTGPPVHPSASWVGLVGNAKHVQLRAQSRLRVDFRGVGTDESGTEKENSPTT